MEEVFGHDGGPLGAGERFCGEPVVPGAYYHRVVHATARELPGGDFECVSCGATFLGPLLDRGDEP